METRKHKRAAIVPIPEAEETDSPNDMMINPYIVTVVPTQLLLSSNGSHHCFNANGEAKMISFKAGGHFIHVMPMGAFGSMPLHIFICSKCSNPYDPIIVYT